MSQFYSIRHVTRFRYSSPVSESIFEIRKEPRTEGRQRCIDFKLFVSPSTRVMSYRDYLGNVVHHFDVPGLHRELQVVGESTVELQSASDAPEALPVEEWQALDRMVAEGDYWDELQPSYFTGPSSDLSELAVSLEVNRRDDPLSLLREINQRVFASFEYMPNSTRVDSPIEEAIRNRAGVCQDFTHVMIALLRPLGIPCRYVSGYLYHKIGSRDRSTDGATHAWVEALLPSLGWIGFDPTNNLLTGDRHIRTAVGRDYADVPPTRGVFKGSSTSGLEVSVTVTPADVSAPEEVPPLTDEWPEGVPRDDWDHKRQQQQQQQQQQQ
ncbi:MAG: transglutaminase family protein [Bryobacteraceae bacterium]